MYQKTQTSRTLQAACLCSASSSMGNRHANMLWWVDTRCELALSQRCFWAHSYSMVRESLPFFTKEDISLTLPKGDSTRLAKSCWHCKSVPWPQCSVLQLWPWPCGISVVEMVLHHGLALLYAWQSLHADLMHKTVTHLHLWRQHRASWCLYWRFPSSALLEMVFCFSNVPSRTAASWELNVTSKIKSMALRQR